MFQFVGSGMSYVSNRFKQLLDGNFDLLTAETRQRLHGGVYVNGSQAETVVTVQGTYYLMAGTLTAQANNYGYDIGTGLSVTHNHAEPTGTTHYYDITAALHISAGNGDDVLVKLRQWDDSASAYVDLAVTSEPMANAGAGSFTGHALLLARAVLDLGDRIEVHVGQTLGTNNVTLLNGSSLRLSGV